MTLKNLTSGGLRHLTGCLTLLFLSTAAIAEQPLLERAQTLLDSGQAQQAYQLLLEQADEHAGSTKFDYLLGKAAIDAGEPLQAIFALERVLDIEPDNAPARAELAHALFLVGENEAAKAQFNKAKQADMPAASRATIERYLSAIDERILGGLEQTAFYVAMGTGFDSNVNSATDTSQIAVPSGTLTLSGNSLELDSAIASLEGGGVFSRALKENLRMYGNADIKLYDAVNEDDFSTHTLDGVVGLHFLHGRNQYRVALVAQNFFVDGDLNRKLLGLNGQWHHTLDARNQLTVFGQYAALTYPNSAILDIDQLSAGVTWLHSFDHKRQPVLYLTGYAGNEDEDASNAEHIGRDYFGVRAGGQVRGSGKLLWSGVLAYQSSEYGEGGFIPSLFGVTREDDYIRLNIAAIYSLNRDWTLQPELFYTKNDSNIELFAYDRVQALVSLRTQFE